MFKNCSFCGLKVEKHRRIVMMLLVGGRVCLLKNKKCNFFRYKRFAVLIAKGTMNHVLNAKKSL